jgi:putative hemin transport protein
MTERTAPEGLATAWRELCRTEAGLRQRDAAARLGVSEAELVATLVGGRARRLRPDWETLLHRLHRLGEVMALTRNEHAVIEKDGHYRNVELFEHAGNVLDEGIDLRLFPHHWAFAYAVSEEDDKRRSIQIYGRDGLAMHKVFQRGDDGRAAFEELSLELEHPDQTAGETVAAPPAAPVAVPDAAIDVAALRARWQALQNTHEFFHLLRAIGASRTQALRLAGAEWAERVEPLGLRKVLEQARVAELPVMLFVGNRGMLQIHSGPVRRLVQRGDWLNVLDPGFSLHLDERGIDGAWVVRKPTSEGIVTSLELYDAAGENILLAFSKRKPASEEISAWRAIVAGLDPLPSA